MPSVQSTCASIFELLVICSPVSVGTYSINTMHRWNHTVADVILAWQNVPLLEELQIILRQYVSPEAEQNIVGGVELTAQAESVYPRDWGPLSDTVPWGPLSRWQNPAHVPTVDARSTSLQRIIKDFVSMGRPVVIANALLTSSDECRAALRL